MRTGLFFGTFNPVHRGHEALAASFFSSGYIDELWIIPTPHPPHKAHEKPIEFVHRWRMLVTVFKDQPHVKLSDIEKHIPVPHYTLKTIEHIKKEQPARDLFLCIGGDTLQTLHTWYRYKEIAPKASLLVAERPGISTSAPDNVEDFRVYICQHEPVDISSSYIRNELFQGNIPGTERLHPRVVDYIIENRLYVG